MNNGENEKAYLDYAKELTSQVGRVKFHGFDNGHWRSELFMQGRMRGNLNTVQINGSRIYTPRRLIDMAFYLSHLPNPFGANMVVNELAAYEGNKSWECLKWALIRTMGFVHVNKECTERHLKGAVDFLAHASFMQPSLDDARRLYGEIGMPYKIGKLDRRLTGQMIEQGFILKEQIKNGIVVRDPSVKLAVRHRMKVLRENIANLVVEK